MAEFGELLRRLRAGRSQKDVAADLEMPVTTLSTLENRESAPRGPVLEKLARYYGVSLTYFYAPEIKPTSAAKAWLQTVSQQVITKNTIAAHAPPNYPEEANTKFAERIREKKHRAKTSHNE